MATHTLKITGGDLGADITFNKVYEYVPRSPEVQTIDYNPGALADGGDILNTAFRNVTESAYVCITDSTTSAVRTRINAIERIFRYAERKQRLNQGSSVYVVWDPGGTGSTGYRSEILTGRVELDEGAFKATQWEKTRIRLRLTWTRRFYWEDLTATDFWIDWITIYNHNDSGHDNFYQIDVTTEVAGTLPSPVTLWIRNTLNDATYMTDVYASISTITNTYTVLEAESAADPTPTPESDATCSGTATQEKETLPAIGTSEAELIEWAINNSWQTTWQGRYARVIARFADTTNLGSTTWRLKWGSSTATGSVFWTGPSITTAASPSSNLVDLGLIRIPPYGIKESPYQTIYLKLWGKRDTGSSACALDCLFLLPADNLRYYAKGSSISGIPYNGYLRDLGYLDSVSYVSGSNAGPGYIVYGRPMVVFPGEDQYLYVVVRDNSTTLISRTINLLGQYYKRRLTI